MQKQRFEKKYRIPEEVASEVREFGSAHLELDEHGAGRASYSCSVHSLYLDSNCQATCWMTINGDKNRYKLRLSAAGTLGLLARITAWPSLNSGAKARTRCATKPIASGPADRRNSLRRCCGASKNGLSLRERSIAEPTVPAKRNGARAAAGWTVLWAQGLHGRRACASQARNARNSRSSAVLRPPKVSLGLPVLAWIRPATLLESALPPSANGRT